MAKNAWTIDTTLCCRADFVADFNGVMNAVGQRIHASACRSNLMVAACDESQSLSDIAMNWEK